MLEFGLQIWHRFDIWASGQPIYIQAAIGAAVFWVLLKLISAVIRLIVFIFQGLFQTRKSYPGASTPKKRAEKPAKAQTDETETPPYFFR